MSEWSPIFYCDGSIDYVPLETKKTPQYKYDPKDFVPKRILSLLNLDYLEQLSNAGPQLIGCNKSTTKKYVIYNLFDPRNFELRYVGYTKNLPDRFWAHIDQRNKLHSHKNHWLKNLVELGFLPICIPTLECDTVQEIKDYEVRCIAHFGKTFRLTNGTKGGDGSVGIQFSLESKRQLSKSLRETNDRKIKQVEKAQYRQHTVESVAKIILANAGEANHQAKLTAKQVIEMRKLMDEGYMNIEICEMFNISPTQVSRIRRKESWKEI